MLRLFFTAAFFSSVSFSAQSAEPARQELTLEAKQLMQNYTKQLKAALGSAMKNGGPMAAIDVCAQKSPEIAYNLSEKSGWTIGRTSLKARNPAGEANNWQKDILLQFEQRKNNGEPIKPMAHSGYSSDKKQFRFMKAIPTQKICLTCHGSGINPKIQNHIAEYYPDDKATGFQLGDIRGAFVLTKEMKKSK